MCRIVSNLDVLDWCFVYRLEFFGAQAMEVIYFVNLTSGMLHKVTLCSFTASAQPNHGRFQKLETNGGSEDGNKGDADDGRGDDPRPTARERRHLQGGWGKVRSTEPDAHPGEAGGAAE